MTIEEAFVLADALAAGNTPVDALEAYGARRRARIDALDLRTVAGPDRSWRTDSTDAFETHRDRVRDRLRRILETPPSERWGEIPDGL